MDSPMHWLWTRLETTLEPGVYATLRGEFEAYQCEYGRWQRHQAKLDRLARLKEALKNPSSRTHMRNVQVQIAKLEAHLEEQQQDQPPRHCPKCKRGLLEVDHEYMQKHGYNIGAIPWQQWTFYCTNEDSCGEAGPWSYFQTEETR